MAKDRKKLQHIHSSIPDKQPTAASLEVGEIAVNNAKDQEFLSIKNSDNKVVRLSSDEQIVTIMEKKEVTPYKGYVRGETGPSSTAGDAPTADSYGSYGITENDLLTNKSNIIVKINQVAAGNTVKHDKINGAKDRYNKLVNPTTDSGLTDGAGFYIDMSRYAMQDANPQFSSTTNTCRTTLNGTTIIRGLGGACGSLLDIKVNSAKTDIETANTEITSTTTIIGTNSATISGNTTLVVSGTTTETKKGDVTETNLANKTESTSGNTCIHSTLDANFGGDANTRIGANCSGTATSDNTYIFAETAVTINAPTTNITGDTNISGDTVIGGDTYLSGDTYFKSVCTSITSNELGTAICEAFDRSVVTMTKEDDPSDTGLSAVYKIFQNGNQIGDDINIPKHSSLTATYEATSGKSGSVIFNTSADKNISIPTCVNHLNRHKITFQSGSTASFNNQTYDPGKDCANSAETINIPTSLTHLNEWDGSCLTVPGCAKATNFYQTSDRNAKENIATPDFGKLVNANNAHVMKFNFKDDPNHVDTYGVIAQDIEELGLNEIVMTDETGRKSVDYTSLMMLKIAYLENENKSLRSTLNDILIRLNKLENKD